MWATAIVEVEVSADRVTGLADAFIGSQIDLLVFDATPQPLNEHVVPPGPFAIHADGDAVAGKQTGERRARELRTLVGVEDFWPAMTSESILQRLDAEGRLHRDRQPPRQNTTCRPVQHHGEINEAVCHWNVRDVHGPDLVRPRDLDAAQQIRIDLVTGLGLGGAWTAIERLYPHPPHQRFDIPAADLAPLGSQQASQDTRTREGEFKVQPIQMPHDREVGRRHRARQIINAAAADLQNVRLLAERQIVSAVDHSFALSIPALVSAPSKKSFSSVSSPILACSDFTSTAGVTGAGLPVPNTLEAPPSSWAFQAVT